MHTLVLNTGIDMEILRQIILFGVTFVITNENPSFSVIKNAQKYGLTIIRHINHEEFIIYTHSTRVNL